MSRIVIIVAVLVGLLGILSPAEAGHYNQCSSNKDLAIKSAIGIIGHELQKDRLNHYVGQKIRYQTASVDNAVRYRGAVTNQQIAYEEARMRTYLYGYERKREIDLHSRGVAIDQDVSAGITLGGQSGQIARNARMVYEAERFGGARPTTSATPPNTASRQMTADEMRRLQKPTTSTTQPRQYGYVETPPEKPRYDYTKQASESKELREARELVNGLEMRRQELLRKPPSRERDVALERFNEAIAEGWEMINHLESQR